MQNQQNSLPKPNFSFGDVPPLTQSVVTNNNVIPNAPKKKTKKNFSQNAKIAIFAKISRLNLEKENK